MSCRPSGRAEASCFGATATGSRRISSAPASPLLCNDPTINSQVSTMKSKVTLLPVISVAIVLSGCHGPCWSATSRDHRQENGASSRRRGCLAGPPSSSKGVLCREVKGFESLGVGHRNGGRSGRRVFSFLPSTRKRGPSTRCLILARSGRLIFCFRTGNSIHTKHRVDQGCIHVLLYFSNLSIPDSDDLAVSVVIGGAIQGFCMPRYLSDHDVRLRDQALNS